MVVGLMILGSLFAAGFCSLVFVAVVADHPWLVAFYAGAFLLCWLCATPWRRARKRREAKLQETLAALGQEFYERQQRLDAAVAAIRARPVRDQVYPPT